MILQALYEYYQRKAADPGSTIAPHGLEWKEILVPSNAMCSRKLLLPMD